MDLVLTRLIEEGFSGSQDAISLPLLQKLRLYVRSELNSSLPDRWASDVREKCWEQLHCGSWKDVNDDWRDLFAFASLHLAQEAHANGDHTKSLLHVDEVREALC